MRGVGEVTGTSQLWRYEQYFALVHEHSPIGEDRASQINSLSAFVNVDRSSR